MTTIGNDTTPGPVTTVTTANFVGVYPSSPQDVALLGPADIGANPGQGNATVDTVYHIVSSAQAHDLFGNDSMLAQACEQALANSVKPLYAVAPAEKTATAEDIGLTAEFSFANAPHKESADHYTITVDSTVQTVIITYDLDAATPAAGECYVDPVKGKGKLSAAPATSATADYTYYDYTLAFDEVSDKVGAVVDFIAPLQENDTVAAELETTVGEMQGLYDFCIGLFGAGTTISDTAAYTNPFDNSRMQGYYPSRKADGSSIMGAIAGKRGALSLSTPALGASLAGVGRLYHRLNAAQKANLLNAKINPIENRAGGASLVDDLTTVADGNSAESGYDTGFSRMVMDEVILVTIQNEATFIGRLNSENTRNALKGVLETQLSNLERSQAIETFKVEVFERDARSADVNVSVELVKGLRNIYNTITAGVRVEETPEDTTVEADGEVTAEGDTTE